MRKLVVLALCAVVFCFLGCSVLEGGRNWVSSVGSGSDISRNQDGNRLEKLLMKFDNIFFVKKNGAVFSQFPGSHNSYIYQGVSKEDFKIVNFLNGGYWHDVCEGVANGPVVTDQKYTLPFGSMVHQLVVSRDFKVTNETTLAGIKNSAMVWWEIIVSNDDSARDQNGCKLEKGSNCGMSLASTVPAKTTIAAGPKKPVTKISLEDLNTLIIYGDGVTATSLPASDGSMNGVMISVNGDITKETKRDFVNLIKSPIIFSIEVEEETDNIRVLFKNPSSTPNLTSGKDFVKLEIIPGIQSSSSLKFSNLSGDESVLKKPLAPSLKMEKVQVVSSSKGDCNIVPFTPILATYIGMAKVMPGTDCKPLPLRSKPNGKILKMLKMGIVLQVLGGKDCVWAKVKSGKITGYVPLRFLKAQ